MWWLELADYFVLKSRLLYNTTERSNIWFFLILKTLGPLQFSKPALAQPHGAEWAGWAHTGIARTRECWPRSKSWAWQQQLSPQPWSIQERATVVSDATSHQFCSGGLDSLLKSGPDSQQNQLLFWSVSGAWVLQKKKKKRNLKKESNKNQNLFQSKINGSTQALQLLQNPSALQSPSSTNTNRNKRLLTEGPQLCSPLVATQRGLLVPAWSTQLATWPPGPPPCPSTTTCLSNKHHGCYTAERTGPRQSQPIPVHLWLTSSFHFLTLPQKVKNKKIKKLRHFPFALGFKTLATMTVTSHR